MFGKYSDVPQLMRHVGTIFTGGNVLRANGEPTSETLPVGAVRETLLVETARREEAKRSLRSVGGKHKKYTR
jgi:hypothetical protein